MAWAQWQAAGELCGCRALDSAPRQLASPPAPRAADVRHPRSTAGPCSAQQACVGMRTRGNPFGSRSLCRAHPCQQDGCPRGVKPRPGRLLRDPPGARLWEAAAGSLSSTPGLGLEGSPRTKLRFSPANPRLKQPTSQPKPHLSIPFPCRRGGVGLPC